MMRVTVSAEYRLSSTTAPMLSMAPVTSRLAPSCSLTERERLRMKPAYGDHSAETAELARTVAHAFFEQRFQGLQHRGDDALGVAGAAAVNVFGVLARRNMRRNRVDVRAEHHLRLSPERQNIGAAGRNRQTSA